MAYALRPVLALFMLLGGTYVATAQDAQSPVAVPGQTGACGQPAMLSQMLPTPLDAGRAVSAELIIMRSEPQYIDFALANAGYVTLRTGHGDDGGDPVLALYDAAGTAIEWDDDSAGNLDAQIAQELEPGSYCAQVRLFGSTPGDDTRVTLSLELGDPPVFIAPCSDPALVMAARSLAPGLQEARFYGEVAPDGRNDLRLTVTQPLSVRLETQDTDFDTMLSLYGPDGALLVENDDGGAGMGTDSRITRDLAEGEYCISVSGYGSGAGAYSLVMAEDSVTALCADPALLGDVGRALAPGMPESRLTGFMGRHSRQDWRLEVSEGFTLRADATSAEFDTVLSLHDAAGQMIVENDDSHDLGGSDSRLVQTLAPGSYCLSLRGYFGNSGEFELALAEHGSQPDDAAGLSMPCSNPALLESLPQSLVSGFSALDLKADVAGQSRRDWHLTVTEGLDLQIDARSDAFDTVLAIYDADGGLLAENDDAEGLNTIDSRLETTLAPGQYCISVRGFGGGSGLATLTVAEIGAGAEPVSVLPTSEVESLGVLRDVLTGMSSSADSVWWSGFEMGEAGSVRLEGLSLGGPFTLRLYDADNVLVAEQSAAGGVDVGRIEERLEPGTYAVGITLDGATTGLGIRQLVLTRIGG